MSERLRRELAERLNPKKAVKAKSLSKNASNPSLHPKSKTTLVPRLASLNTKSSTNMPKPRQLEPISPYLKTQKEPKESLKPIVLSSTQKLPNQTSAKQKPLPPIELKSKKKHVHGDMEFLKQRDLVTPDQNATPYDFIQVIKSDPELQEDFWYFVRDKDAYDFKLRPFSLKLQNSEYLTISSRGVTHFVRGEAHFSTLEDWEREYKLYQKIKEIRFFKQYKTWKNFSIWKNSRRRNMMNERAQFLQNELFILDEKLGNALLEIRSKNWEMLKFEFLDLNSERVRSLEAFNEHQEQRREKVAEELEKLETRIKDVVKVACEESLTEFKKESKTNLDEDQEKSEEEIDPFLAGDLSNKKMPYTQEAIIRTHYKRLSKFVRLCDYQIIDAKISLSLTFTQKVLNVIAVEYTRTDRRRAKRSPLISVMGDFKSEHVLFLPDCENLKVAFDNSILRGLTMLLNNLMLVNAEDFETYTKAVEEFEDKQVEEDFDLLQTVINDEKIKQTEKEIKQGLEAAFEKLVEYSEFLKPSIEKYIANGEMDFEKVKEMDPEKLKQLIEEFLSQENEFKNIQNSKDLGMLQLILDKVKQKLIPSPQTCLRKLKKILPEMAFELGKTLTESLLECNRNLKGIPKTVEDFVWHVRCIRDAENKMEDITNRVSELKDLMQLMDSYSFKYPEPTQRKYKETLTQLDNLRTKMQNFYKEAESDKIKFTRELREKINKVDKRVTLLKEKLNDERISNKDSPTGEMETFLSDIGEEVEELVEDTKAYNSYLVELEIEPKGFESVNEMAKDFKRKRDLWKSLHEWQFKILTWNETTFKDIDVDNMNKTVESYYRIAQSCRALEDEGNFVPQILKAKIETLRDTIPVIVDLRSQSLRESHWDQIKELLQKDINVNDPELTLKKLMEMKVNNFKEEIAEIALRAKKEEEIRAELNKVVSSWNEVEFMFKYEKEGDYYIFTEIEDIQNKLEDTQVILTTLITNRFVGPVYEEVDYHNKNFKLFSQTFDEWLECQKQWAELEKIFKNPDIAKKLKESKKFLEIDEQFRQLMKDTYRRPKALEAATKPELYRTLKLWNDSFEKLQKNLENFLDNQRKNFPRFFFLSNDELILILSNSKNIVKVQPSLKNMFEAINELELDGESKDNIAAILSPEKERVEMPTGTKARGNIEEWLGGLERAMVTKLRMLMGEAVKDYKTMSRREFVVDERYPCQIVMAVGMIMWCSSTEECLSGSDSVQAALDDWYEEINSYLDDLTQLVREDLNFVLRRKVVALVTQDVHNRDIVESMSRDEGLKDMHDFKWQQQLRYYWDDLENECRIRQVNAEFPYGYEFIGATSRLVITSLTDRCWMTITGALRINLGAAPAGPAGTGKTESTKDLAKAMGQYCIVFNCSEQITYQMMEKLFVGLCYTGAWSCLDEFNRIDIEVLSVIAQQLRIIKNAKDENKEEFYLEDKKPRLKSTMGVFITMNPGYAGRTELPDNLKVMFRPVSMMVPDYTIIAQIMLYAEGFQSAQTLSGKMTKLYKLASEQLSQQRHYDFGMRAVKSVLNMAGSLKRKEPHLSEDVVLIRAMRDSNLPKFLKEDLGLFNAIVNDLFPGVEIPEVDYGEFEKAIRESLEEESLQPEPVFIEKVIQLFQTFEVRFGVMIVGPASSGKSTSYKVLAKAMTKLRERKSKNSSFQKVIYQVLNPKSISMGELFGDYNKVTQDWKDGLASSIMREFSKSDEQTRRWVVFDGPVDSLWIENMNTVLDDNMMLCLANQERIKLKHEMRMLFEVLDLEAASPATVSRCGMVYMNIEVVDWSMLVKTWLAKGLPGWDSDKKNYLKSLIVNYLGKALNTVRKYKEPIPTMNNNLVRSFCNLVNALSNPDTCPRLNDDFEAFKKYCDKLFVFCLTWSLGGALDSTGMLRFDSQLSTDLDMELPKGSLYGCFVNSSKKGGEYVTWESIQEEFVYNSEMSYFQILVPTVDTVRFEQLLRYNISIKNPTFITGYTGVGKSVIISNTLNKMKESENLFPIYMTFSAQTSSLETQNSIFGKLDSKRKDVFGGPGTKKVALMVDDVNMPTLEQYGAQPPIELLRQYCDQGSMYDRDKLFPLKIIETTLICSAAPPEGGRSPLTPRFTRHFHMVCIPKTSEESMRQIFTTILEGFFKQGFKTEIIGMTSSIVSSTISIYQMISSDLLPTPKKSHYLFNLRDVSKVFQGILMAKPKNFMNPDNMVMLWVHECLRVFHDRLINSEDKLWFTNSLVKLLAQYFSRPETHEELFEKDPIIFADFIKGDLDISEREYEIAKDPNTLSNRIKEFLEDYNTFGKNQMELVFFKDAIEHLCRICRVLRQNRGNGMLIGVGGCGKQSLTKLAAFICKCSIFPIQVTRDYKLQNFRDDLKRLYFQAGGADPDSPNGLVPEPTVFLLTDNQITQERFLEDINNILNSGEVPNLFNKEEQEKIEQDLRPVADAQKVTDSAYNFFIERVRDNLHIVLCMSPVGDALRTRMRMFPSLVNCCTINWVDPWPNDALLSVSKSKMKDLPLADCSKEEGERLRSSLAEMCRNVHQSVLEMADEFYEVLSRRVYITPKSYLDMIQCYFELLREKQDELTFQRNRYRSGVEQLVKTNLEVQDMQQKLTELAPVLEQKKQSAEELQKKVEADSVEANIIKEKVEEEAREVNLKAQEAQTLQEEAEGELNKAIPILKEAEKSVQEIEPREIDEIKGFKAPPGLVVFTLECVAILFETNTAWDNIKRNVLQGNLVKSLQNYPADKIKEITLRKLKSKMNSNPDFTEEKVGKQSKAARSLCKWVYAIQDYARISKEVEPKRQKLEELNKVLAEAKKNYQEAAENLQVELDKVQALEDKLTEVKNELESTNNEIEKTNLRISRASVLTVGLKDEHARWEVAIEKLNESIGHVLGDVFLSAACISYYGPFTGVYRNKLVDFWKQRCSELEIPVSEHFELQEVMGDPVEIREWNIMGLPTDSVSVNNAILVKRSLRWPLMIDPQEQANKWIKNMEESNRLKIVKQTDKDFSRSLEMCLRDGVPMLIEDMGETINPVLDPVLLKSIVETTPGHFILRMGESEVDYHKNFRLYMTSKLANPHYLPETSIKVAITNFTVTRKGLEEQLLGDVVRKEEPKIENEQNKLVKEISDGTKELKQLEISILTSLSDSKDSNILDNAELIKTLENSKLKSDHINKRMVSIESTKKKNEETRELYKSVAVRGSILYFVVADLANIDPMYQFSLTYFSKLFNIIIDQTPKSSTKEQRILSLIKAVTEVIFKNVCRGLFNQHKLIFSFLIGAEILKQKEEIADSEWSLLLRGVNIIPSNFKKSPNPDPNSIPEKSWNFVVFLQNVSPCFKQPLLGEEISSNLMQWLSWINSKEPQNEALPAPYQGIPPFQKMLLLKAFREEKVIYSVIDFVQETLGKMFVQVPPTSMEEVYSETTKRTPIIFILSQGADPMAMIQKLAKERDSSDRLDLISLGKGQDEKARRAIERGTREGKWVVLQNCHLARSFMPELNKIVEHFEDPRVNMHEEFRIYLTSMPSKFFPIPILQNGVKITIEPPKGIKSNVTRSLNFLSEEKLSESSKPQVLSKIMFSLCLFHSVIQERRRFGPLGWNIKYEFNDSDLETSMKVIENFIEEQSMPPWEAMKYVTGEINYGGRVTDDLDRRLLMNMLSNFLDPEILSSEYSFSESGIYHIPEELSLQGMKNYVEQFPINDEPEIFGMHDNANITYQQQESNLLLGIALSIQPKEKSSSFGKSADELVDELAENFKERLPNNLLMSEAGSETFVVDKNGLMDAMATFLKQEMERFNKLLGKIRSSLVELRKAIKGETLMSDELDKTFTAIQNNLVPESWANCAYPSLKPLGSWFEDLSERVKFLRKWLVEGKPQAYWISAFFFPQGFLTAVLQSYARKFHFPIDSLSFTFEIQNFTQIEEITDKPEEGVLVHGLYMEGCKWDFEGLQLADSNPGEMYFKAPVILFEPAENRTTDPEDYLMPVYKTSERAGTLSTTGHSTNYIISIECPTTYPPSFWVLRGAAFLCQLNN